MLSWSIGCQDNKLLIIAPLAIPPLCTANLRRFRFSKFACISHKKYSISTEINAYCGVAKLVKRHMLLLNGRAIFHEKREGKGDQEARQRDSRKVRATGSATVKPESSNRRRTTVQGGESRPQGRFQPDETEGTRLESGLRTDLRDRK